MPEFKSKCKYCGKELFGADAFMPCRCEGSQAQLRKTVGTYNGGAFTPIHKLQDEDFERIRRIVREEIKIVLEKNMNEDGLKPCPFCGSTDVHWTHSGGYAYIVCDKCEVQGPPFYSEGEFGTGAEDLWNRRILHE
jgi:Lar family restriction alleviation protein